MIDIHEIYDSLDEALTIPEKGAGPVEIELRKKLKTEFSNFKYGDTLVKFCRNDEKSNMAQEHIRREYLNGLRNLIDLFNAYDSLKKQFIRQKIDKKIEVIRADGKTAMLDPVKDFGKIGRLSVLRDVISGMEKLVRGNISIDTNFKKYALDDEDRINIRLIGSGHGLVVFATRYFKTSQKFAVHLWQNVDTIDSAGEYGHPERQCPYCTHAKSHWDYYSGKENSGYDKYMQYWMFFNPEGSETAPVGDLTSPAVVKIYNAMRGRGSKLLVGNVDSLGYFCDYEDTDFGDICKNNRLVFPYRFNSNGASDKDVSDLYNKVLGISYKGLAGGRLPWESRATAEIRMNCYKHGQILPTADIDANDKELDPGRDATEEEIDCFDGRIDITGDMFENGRLKFKLPKTIKRDFHIDNAEIKTFDNFPKHILDKTTVSFINCKFDISDSSKFLEDKTANFKFIDCNGVVNLAQFATGMSVNSIMVNSANKTIFTGGGMHVNSITAVGVSFNINSFGGSVVDELSMSVIDAQSDAPIIDTAAKINKINIKGHYDFTRHILSENSVEPGLIYIESDMVKICRQTIDECARMHAHNINFKIKSNIIDFGLDSLAGLEYTEDNQYVLKQFLDLIYEKNINLDKGLLLQIAMYVKHDENMFKDGKFDTNLDRRLNCDFYSRIKVGGSVYIVGYTGNEFIFADGTEERFADDISNHDLAVFLSKQTTCYYNGKVCFAGKNTLKWLCEQIKKYGKTSRLELAIESNSMADIGDFISNTAERVNIEVGMPGQTVKIHDCDLNTIYIKNFMHKHVEIKIDNVRVDRIYTSSFNTLSYYLTNVVYGKQNGTPLSRYDEEILNSQQLERAVGCTLNSCYNAIYGIFENCILNCINTRVDDAYDLINENFNIKAIRLTNTAINATDVVPYIVMDDPATILENLTINSNATANKTVTLLGSSLADAGNCFESIKTGQLTVNTDYMQIECPASDSMKIKPGKNLKSITLYTWQPHKLTGIAIPEIIKTSGIPVIGYYLTNSKHSMKIKDYNGIDAYINIADCVQLDDLHKYCDKVEKKCEFKYMIYNKYHNIGEMQDIAYAVKPEFIVDGKFNMTALDESAYAEYIADVFRLLMD